MSERKSVDHLIKPLLLGFFSGLLLLVVYYHVLFTISSKEFSFIELYNLHLNASFLIFIDLLPIVGIFLALHVVNKINKEKNKLQQLLVKEKESKKEALSALENLKNGEFDKEITADPENEFLILFEELRHTLQKNRESDDLRKRDDDHRNWASEGLAMFSEILRQPGDNTEAFAYELISKLVKYLDANQGGYFLKNEDEKSKPCLQMLACYAYDRKKFADRKIEWGNGIIGTCALEKKTIYLTKIPDNYLLITSGLGKATPGYLLLVPMVVGDELLGVIELASFRKFEKYQISFCEKLAESIAMTLSGINNNARTTLLLQETRAQAEALALQEERMRQNMSELKATQEQAAKQAEKFISFTNSVNHTLIRAEYDINGVLLYANTKFLKKMGFSGNREVEGKHISAFIHEKDREWFHSIWETLANGGEHFEGYMKHITKQGQDIWTMATYTCVRTEDGSVEKVLFLAIDTTEYKKQSLDYESQIDAINKLNLKAEFMPDGKLISYNELFKHSLKYPEKELDLKSIYDFLNKKDLENFVDIWDKVIHSKAHQGQLRLITRLDEEKWFRSTFTSVNDMYGEVSKVVFLANEITNERLMEIESRKQTEKLKMQEEKLRLTWMDLERKLQDAEHSWNVEKQNLSNQLKLSENIMDFSNLLIFSVDNSGILVYINEPACKYFKIKRKEFINQSASKIFDLEQNSYPEFITSLIDPAKNKKQED
jgi:PAS domain S-box-containing protein